MNNILHYWPWAGLFLSLVLTLFLTLRKRGDVFQVGWWFAILLPLYMLHQFEEHGIDLFGHAYAFQPFFCHVLGFQDDLVNCPATPWFLMMVNVGTVWVLGACAWWFGSRRPFVGAAMNALLLTNGMVHIASGLRFGIYNPGLATSILFFLPVSIWTYRFWIKQKVLKMAYLPLSIGCGVLIHLVLMGSVKAFQFGWIDDSVLGVIQVVNGLFPVALGFLLSPQGKAEVASSMK